VIAVVGLGLMGASLAGAIRQARPEVQVLGVESDPAVLLKAVDRGYVTAGGDDLAITAGADLTVLAIPIGAMRAVLAALPKGGLVTDLASTKRSVLEWSAEAGVDLVGGHPMCGSERSGIDAADPNLYQGAAWVLTRAEPRVEELVRAVGAVPVVMDAERHDRVVAGVSHAAFLLAAAYMLSAAASPDWPDLSRLAASGFRDMTRLAAGSPEMYTDIARTNADNAALWLAAVEAEIAKVRRHLEAGDARLAELFEEAQQARERWERERRA